MSLINRMLDDLASRQAPGTESLQGVRLHEPLQSASDAIDRTKLGMLLLVIAAITGLGWWLWPGRAEIPVPQARPAPATVATPVPRPEPPPVRAAVPESPPAAPAPAAEAVPKLQLAARLSSLETARDASAVLDDAERVERLREPAPTRAPPSPVRAPNPVGTKPTAQVSVQKPPADAVAPPILASAPAIDPAVERRQRARQALVDQDPASALGIVSATDASRDVESAALRAAALQRLGRHAEAVEVYASLTTRDPAEPGHWVGLGISLEGEQRREPARMAYRRALQSDRLAPSLRAFAQDRITVLEAP